MRHNCFECQHAQLLEAKDPGKGWKGWLFRLHQLDPSVWRKVSSNFFLHNNRPLQLPAEHCISDQTPPSDWIVVGSLKSRVRQYPLFHANLYSTTKSLTPTPTNERGVGGKPQVVVIGRTSYLKTFIVNDSFTVSRP